MSALAVEAGVVEATRRLTAGQRRAAMHVLDDRASYTTLEALAEAIALAVVTAEDDATRRVAVVRDGSAVYVYGPYASEETARKVLERSGLATTAGARAAVLPLIAAPRSPLSKRQTAPPKRPAKGKVTA